MEDRGRMADETDVGDNDALQAALGQLQSCFERVIENAYVRAAATSLGSSLDQMSASERLKVKDRYATEIARDIAYCVSVGTQYIQLGKELESRHFPQEYDESTLELDTDE